MRIRVRESVTRVVDIGELDYHERLPIAPRKGRRTPCSVCRRNITDEYFIGAIKQGWPNMMFHESCFDES